MWSELENDAKVPHCTSEKCECGIGINGLFGEEIGIK